MASTKGAPCATDGDCAGWLVCFPNATVPWVQAQFGQSVCWCPGPRSFEGPTCETRHESETMLILYFLVQFLGAAFIVGSGVWCLWGFLRVARSSMGAAASREETISLRTPLVQTCLMCTLSGILIVLTNGLASSCVFSSEMWVLNPASNKKTCKLNLPQNILGICQLIVGYLAVLNVSVTWISIVMNVQSLSVGPNRTNRMVRLITAVRFTEVVFVVCAAVALVLRDITLAIIILIPFDFLLIFAYSVAGWYLSRMLSEAVSFEHERSKALAVSSEPPSPGGQPQQQQQGSTGSELNSHAVTGLRRALTRIRITVFGVVFTSLMLFVFLVAGSVISLGATGGNSLFEPGGWDRAGLFVTNAALVWGLCNILVVQWFVTTSALARIRKADRVLSASSSPSRDFVARSARQQQAPVGTRGGALTVPRSNVGSQMGGA